MYLFNFGSGAIWNVIWCEYKHLSSGPVSSEDWRGSNVRPGHGQTPPVSCWCLAGFAPNHRPLYPPHALQPVTLETWETPICLRLVRVNRISPCPSRFKAEPARRRLILRLPSSIRQLGRNAQATLPPPLFLGKMKRRLHVWIFIRANETLRKLAEWSHLGALLRDDNNHRRA